MTKKENYIRFNQYPNGSILLFQMICNKCKNIEKEILKLFKQNFKLRKDIGNEYFEGDYQKMELAITLTRITFPFLMFISLASFFSAILNSHDKFAVASAAPIILNILLM